MDNCFVNNQFYPGTNVISLVNHSPEVNPGDMVRIVRIWEGNLCAVQLPNGMIHRWFASFELEPEYNYSKCPLEHGGFATVINTEGHGNPPHIEVGTTVKIVRCIPTLFYDLILCTGEYHRWLADFELAYPI